MLICLTLQDVHSVGSFSYYCPFYDDPNTDLKKWFEKIRRKDPINFLMGLHLKGIKSCH